MGLSDAMVGVIEASLGTTHTQATQLTNTFDRNLTQALGVIQNTIVQSVGATADDAQLMASMQTASRVPQQGQTPAAT